MFLLAVSNNLSTVIGNFFTSVGESMFRHGMSAAANAPPNTPVKTLYANAQSNTANSIAQSLPVNSNQQLRLSLQTTLGSPEGHLTSSTVRRLDQSAVSPQPAQINVAAY
jgi:hypothetical protein